jgi:hypothetical protein
MKIYVKNMYSQRAIAIIREEIDRLNINYKSIEVGEINFNDDITLKEINKLDLSLHRYKLSLILLNSKIVTDIRNIILETADQNILSEVNIRDYLTRKLGYNYDYLNMYFTLETGLSIEKYYNEKTVEKMCYSYPHDFC